jgi:hypothetical protein
MLNKSLYITGLTHMASSLSKNIGPSFVEVDCFDKNNFDEEFAKSYDIKKEDVKLRESKYTMKDILLSWFGKDETNITDSLLYWIEFDSGKAIKVYEYTNNLDELLSRSEGGVSNFYFVEDIYFIEFDNVIMSFILGNNE